MNSKSQGATALTGGDPEGCDFLGSRMHTDTTPDEPESISRKDQIRSTEEDLIARILNGDRESFVDLIRPYQRTVYATLVSMLGSKEDAEDVAQDVLMKALARLGQFRRESAFGTWLIQIAINEGKMRKRKLRRGKMFSLTNGSEQDGTYIPKDFADWREIPSEALDRSEVRDALVKALALLEEHYRLAFILRDVNELSITETADILGISRGAVKTRLRRARLLLRDILSPGLRRQGGEMAIAFKEVKGPWE
jgi:RNA polymerase sigma-70 factor (ECF subfamily)